MSNLQVLHDILWLAKGGNAEARRALDEYAKDNRRLIGRAILSSLNETDRSIEFVAATETPVSMPDYDRWEVVDEVLMADGFEFAGNADSVSFIDSHDRSTVHNAFGRARNWKTEQSKVVCRVFFGTDEDSKKVFGKYRDGTLTDCSIGYTPQEKTYVAAGVSATINGKTFSGPVNVVTKYPVRELSACIAAADPFAAVRALVDSSTTWHTIGTSASYEVVDSWPGGLNIKGRAPNPIQGINPKASAAGNPQQEGSSMEPSNTPGTTPAVGEQRTATAPTQPTATVIDTEAIRAAEERGRLAEIGRQNEIRQLGELANIEASAVAPFLTDPKRTVDEARTAFLKIVSERNKAEPVIVTVGNDKGSEAIREAGVQGIQIRAGYLREFNGKWKDKAGRTVDVHPEAGRYSHMSLQGMIRTVLAAHGRRDAASLEGASLLTALRTVPQAASDFAILFENSLNKNQLMGFVAGNTVWRSITSTMPMNDLRSHGLFKSGQLGLMPEIGETAEVPMVKISDGKKEVLYCTTHAQIIPLSEEAIINDDLDVLTKVPFEIGQSAELTLENAVFYTLCQGTNNVGPTMNEDAAALFNATAQSSAGGHDNYVSSGTAPAASSGAALDTGYSKFRTKLGLNGQALNLVPAIVLVTESLERATRRFLASEYIPGSVNERNLYNGNLQIYSSPLIANGATWKKKSGTVSSTGDTTGWYLMTDPSSFQHLTVGFLGGQQAPEVINYRPNDILALCYRSVLRFGVGISDWRGLYYNNGA